jgi:hypothetical protein
MDRNVYKQILEQNWNGAGECFAFDYVVRDSVIRCLKQAQEELCRVQSFGIDITSDYHQIRDLIRQQEKHIAYYEREVHLYPYAARHVYPDDIMRLLTVRIVKDGDMFICREHMKRWYPNEPICSSCLALLDEILNDEREALSEQEALGGEERSEAKKTT